MVIMLRMNGAGLFSADGRTKVKCFLRSTGRSIIIHTSTHKCARMRTKVHDHLWMANDTCEGINHLKAYPVSLVKHTFTLTSSLKVFMQMTCLLGFAGV